MSKKALAFDVLVFVTFLGTVVAVWRTVLPGVLKLANEFVLLVVAVAITLPRRPGSREGG